VTTNLIRADYTELESIAEIFIRSSDRVRDLHQSLDERFARLKNGGWNGENADGFFRAIDEDVLPAIVRLYQALGQAAETTHEISRIFREAEAQAARQLLIHDDEPVYDDIATVPPDKPTLRYSLPSEDTVGDERSSLINAINILLELSGDREDVLIAIPELANLDQLTDDELEALLEELLERARLLEILITTNAMYGAYRGNIPLPPNLQQLSVEVLRELLNSNEQNERYINILWNLGLWAIVNNDPYTAQNIQDRFWELSSEERFDFLYSLYMAMEPTAEYQPGDVIDLAQLPPPEVVAHGEPSPAVAALLMDTVTEARAWMALAATDEEVYTTIASSWVATFYPDEGMGESILNFPGALAAVLTPTIVRRLSNLGIVAAQVENVESIFSRIAARGKGGLQRARQFFRGLTDNGLRRLGEGFDGVLNNRIYSRLDDIRALEAKELRRMGYTDFEINNRNLALMRTDVPVNDLAEHGVVFGATRNQSHGANIAFEYEASGKPDPTLAIYVPTGSRYTEFDWYALGEDGSLTLIDAKNIGTTNSAYDFRGGSVFSRTDWGRDAQTDIIADATEQSRAARLIGATVEWRVPAGTSAEIIQALEARFAAEGLDNIVVVRHTS
jgi:WXG100 family type VII secretion target